MSPNARGQALQVDFPWGCRVRDREGREGIVVRYAGPYVHVRWGPDDGSSATRPGELTEVGGTGPVAVYVQERRKLVWPVPYRTDRAVVVCSGPSMAGVDLAALCDAPGLVVAVNESWRALPRYDCCCTVDTVSLALRFGGAGVPIHVATCAEYGTTLAKAVCDREAPPGHWWRWMRRGDHDGLSVDHHTLHGCGNSGYAALNLAYLTGAKRILILGLDLRAMGTHWHYHSDRRPPANPSVPYAVAQSFARAADQLAEDGVEVIHGSPDSLVDCWDRMTPERAIARYLAPP